MRKLKRNIARTNMRKQGIRRINHTEINKKGKRTGSFFSKNWREYA